MPSERAARADQELTLQRPGYVRHEFERDAAIEGVASLFGVVGVIGQIKVR